jgi:hypothetical protein
VKNALKNNRNHISKTLISSQGREGRPKKNKNITFERVRISTIT